MTVRAMNGGVRGGRVRREAEEDGYYGVATGRRAPEPVSVIVVKSEKFNTWVAYVTGPGLNYVSNGKATAAEARADGMAVASNVVPF